MTPEKLIILAMTIVLLSLWVDNKIQRQEKLNYADAQLSYLKINGTTEKEIKLFNNIVSTSLMSN